MRGVPQFVRWPRILSLMLTLDMFRGFIRGYGDASTQRCERRLIVSQVFYDKVVAKEPSMTAYLVVPSAL